MAKPFHDWTVLPHGKLTRLDENLHTVIGILRMPPMGDVPRRMTIVRLSDGRLVVYSAIALAEAEMKEIEALGRPAFLIVPSDIHRMDARAWKRRYPTMQVIAPAGAAKKVERIVRVDASTVDFDDPQVHFMPLPGTKERESALLVETAAGTTLILNDIIFNLPNRRGVLGWLFKKIGMTSDQPHVPPLVKKREVDDTTALREQLQRWSHLPGLKRVIVSHGNIIADEPGRVLDRIAHELAA